MNNVSERSVLQYLIEVIPSVSALVARLLERAEDIQAREEAELESADSEWLRKESNDKGIIEAAELLIEKFPELGNSGELIERLRRLIERAWNSDTRRTHRRADVLEITCQLLARAEHPSTFFIVRFAIVLSLRAVYRIRFDADSVDRLRVTYDDLRGRFAEQQRRRIRKSSSSLEHFLIDLLALNGNVHRALGAENRAAYYSAFSTLPLGVDGDSRTRRFAPSRDWPELRGALPDFPSVLNLAFGHPLCIPGLDEVLGGMIPALPASAELGGGQVTLVAGSPGSGKTTLCLSIASRLAELGTVVRYVATEEDSNGLELKLAMIGGENFLARAMWGESASGFSKDFGVVQGRSFSTLKDLAEEIEAELINTSVYSDGASNPVFPLYARAVVVDSLSILMNARSQPLAMVRRDLGSVLLRLRELGVFVLLVGGESDPDDQGLAYLVDNVFLLGTDAKRSPQHPLRTINVHKTRLQAAHRGKHALHLSRSEGCVVHPSLHAVLRLLHDRPEIEPDSKVRAVLFSPRQLALPRTGAAQADAVSIRSRAQTLLYGWGSAGKARLALSLAFENRSSSELQPRHAEEARVLVISFLYSEAYYRTIADQLLQRRVPRRRQDVLSRLSVMALYPGYLDPETLVDRVRRRIWGAKLEGRPYTCVVVDGIHNVLLQYPLLEHEKLLWPAFYRLMRTEGLDVISTFTFFEIPADPTRQRKTIAARETAISAAQDVFFHLLVSSCDYSFVIEKLDSPHLLVRLAASLDGGDGRSAFIWNADSFRVDYERTERLA